MNNKPIVSYKMSVYQAKSMLYEYYKNVVQGFVSSGIYAVKRQQFVKKLIKTYIIITLCFSPWIYKGIVSGVNTSDMAALVLSLVCVILPIIFLIYFFAYLIIDKDFSNVIKSDCLFNLLKTLLKMDISKEKETITDDEIKQSCLFEKWNTRFTEDSFIAISDIAKYKFSETDMVYKTGSGRSTYAKPIFDGLLIKVENTKNLNSAIQITTKTKESIMEDTQDYTKISFLGYSIGILILLGVLYGIVSPILFKMPFFEDFVENTFIPLWQTQKFYVIAIFTVFVLIISKIYRDWDVKRLQEKQRLRNSQKLKTGDSRIDEDFDIILSDNSSDVYKIVNQDLAQLILNIKTLFDAPKVQMKFYGNSILLAIFTNQDLFELGDLRHTPLNPKVSNSFISQIAGILMFMDYVETLNK